jgi:hypothetical protein
MAVKSQQWFKSQHYYVRFCDIALERRYHVVVLYVMMRRKIVLNCEYSYPET